MHRISLPRALFLVAFFACTLPAAAIASLLDQGYILDQPPTDVTANKVMTLGAPNDANHYVAAAQSFTAGDIADLLPLTAVELDLRQDTGGTTGGQVKVEIRNYDTDHLVPGSMVLGTSQTVSEANFGTDWTAFFFGGVSLTSGITYSIVVLPLNDEQFNVAYNTDSNSYTAGARYYDLNEYSSEPSGTWVSGGGDLRFRTYHSPEPSTLVGLLSMGVMGLVGYGWRRRRR